MGAVSGQELGLGSGIVNSARQLGFGIGIAVLVAIFTAVYDHQEPATGAQANQYARALGMGHSVRRQTLNQAFKNPNDQEFRPFMPMNGISAGVSDIAANGLRRSFAWAFRAAALFVLLAIPLALTMRRSPAQAMAEARAAAAARATATAGG
jgi:hypothetical protein